MPVNKISRRSALKLIGTGIAAGLLGRHFSELKKPVELEKSPPNGLLKIPDNPQTIITRGRSAKSVIEGWPDVRTKEMEWYKTKGTRGELKQDVVLRTPDRSSSVYLSRPLKSSLHTHLKLSQIDPPMAYPSPADIENIFLSIASEIRSPGSLTPTMHVASIDQNGKVTGYGSMRVTKRLVSEYKNKNPELAGILEKIKQIKFRRKEDVSGYIDLVGKLKKFGLQLRATPMPGHKFEKYYFTLK